MPRRRDVKGNVATPQTLESQAACDVDGGGAAESQVSESGRAMLAAPEAQQGRREWARPDMSVWRPHICDPCNPGGTRHHRRQADNEDGDEDGRRVRKSGGTEHQRDGKAERRCP